MPVISANRDSVDDRFSVLGFTIRTESPLFEIGIATDPELFKPENRQRRNRRNFFSSRAGGVLRARRGEAVYLVPPEVMANFLGQSKLFFGLATYPEDSRGRPNAVQNPTSGSMFVNIAGLTERGLRRMTGRLQTGPAANESLDWGGDALGTAAATSPVAAYPPAAGPAATAQPPQAKQPYDDGFGPMPEPDSDDHTARQGSVGGVGKSAAPPPAPAHSASLGVARASPRAPVRAQEIITPYYDPSNPGSALACQNDAFSLAREEWFVGVDDTRAFPHSAICQINTVDAAGNGWGGTGFYIGRNRILTAAHVLQGMAAATVIPGKNGSEEPFGRFTVNSSSWRIAPAYAGAGNYETDLAVIDNAPLPAPNGQWFGFLNATPSDRLTIVVCGYSAASDAVPELTQAIDGDKQHLHGGYARSQSTPEVIEYPILTLHGASGAPVYHLSEREGRLQALICAVHVTGQPAAQGLNRGCFITPNKIDWIERRAAAFGFDPAALQGSRAGFARPASRPTTPAKAMAVVEIASAIVGAAMTRILDNEGDISWELDQLQGLKHPFNDASKSGGKTFSTKTITVEGPHASTVLGADEIYADCELTFQYNGHSLGNIQVAVVHSNDAIGGGLTVKEQIMDEANTYTRPPSAEQFAAVKLRFHYRFSWSAPFVDDYIAITDLTLFGDGNYSQHTRWTQG